MLKWANVSEIEEKGRYDFLSSFMKSQGFENTWEHVAASSDTFIELVRAQMQIQDQILVSPTFGEEIRKNLVDLSTKHYFSPTSDALYKQESTWLPRSFLEDTFIETLNKQSLKFDIQASALIIGHGTLARVAINGFLKVGYNKISICAKNKDDVDAFMQDYAKRNFNVNFKFVSQDELAYLPGTSSLLVNTESSDPTNDLMNDLFYFNYLNKDAVVIDLNLYPIESPLLIQARDLGIQMIDGYKFHAMKDFAWMQAVTKSKMKWDGFLEAWLSSTKASAETSSIPQPTV
jgi:hypothetical protein